MLLRTLLFRFGSALCLSYQYVSVAVPFAACPFDSFSTRLFSIRFDSVANRVVANLFRFSALPRSSLPLLFCDIRCDSITCRVYSIPLPFSSLRRTSASSISDLFLSVLFRFGLLYFFPSIASLAGASPLPHSRKFAVIEPFPYRWL